MVDTWEIEFPATVRTPDQSTWYEFDTQTPQWAGEAARRVLVSPVDKGVHCEHCPDLAGRARLGARLAGDAEERVEWCTPWAVRLDDGRVLLVCGDCIDEIEQVTVRP